MNSPRPDKPPLTIEDIDAGLELVEAKTKPDPIDLLEKETVETRRLQNKLARSRIKDQKSDRRLREKYADRILYYLETYSITVGSFVVLDGWDVFGFSLAPEIIATLVGSTAVAAIGLVGFVARGLFKPPSA